MTTRLKIDISQGFLEVEGSETFVKAIYKDFKIHFIGEEAGETLERPARRRRKTTEAAKTAQSSAPAVKTKPDPAEDIQLEPVEELPPEIEASKPEGSASPYKQDYTLLKELDLSAGENRVSLVEFMLSLIHI